MKSTNKDRFTFREIADEWAREEDGELWPLARARFLDELLTDFWLGHFEPGGQTCLTVDDTTGGRITPMPFDRRMMLRVMPTGMWWVPEEVRKANPDSPDFPWHALARMPSRDYDQNWLRAYPERLTISAVGFRAWALRRGTKLPRFAGAPQPQEPTHSPNNEIGIRIRKVLESAAQKKKAHPTWGHNQIANLLAQRDSDQNIQGYGYEAVRQILRGDYLPARRRGFRGLAASKSQAG